MSQGNVKVVQSLFRGVEERDLEAYLSAWDREIVVVCEPDSLPYGGKFRGSEGVRRHAAAWLRTWSPLQPGDERKLGAAFVGAGDDVVVRWRLRARAPDGERTLDMPMVSLYKVCDGKVKLAQMFYSDTAEMLRFLKGAR